ncbi:metallophosphoesterase [Candidatus Dojkabacteria bacterium]|uniref:Metallophosphoesterase n=1 Tax=Candidatus Dojkabacteria bacterium TaxID=2099670 RepID=A0A955L980_9BACT|nr:metallophosphoesterase [Candidatus Dojkabacteria bacterium]
MHKIAVVADLHVKKESESLLDYLLGLLNDSEIDLVIMNGDIVNSVYSDTGDLNYEAFMKLYRQYKEKIVIVPGNHDYATSHMNEEDFKWIKQSKNIFQMFYRGVWLSRKYIRALLNIYTDDFVKHLEVMKDITLEGVDIKFINTQNDFVVRPPVKLAPLRFFYDAFRIPVNMIFTDKTFLIGPKKMPNLFTTKKNLILFSHAPIVNPDEDQTHYTIEKYELESFLNYKKEIFEALCKQKDKNIICISSHAHNPSVKEMCIDKETGEIIREVSQENYHNPKYIKFVRTLAFSDFNEFPQQINYILIDLLKAHEPKFHFKTLPIYKSK